MKCLGLTTYMDTVICWSDDQSDWLLNGDSSSSQSTTSTTSISTTTVAPTPEQQFSTLELQSPFGKMPPISPTSMRFHVNEEDEELAEDVDEELDEEAEIPNNVEPRRHF
jgi:hypothetical protein